MSQNPYQSPEFGPSFSAGPPDGYASSKVQGPAIGLIVTAVVGMLWALAMLAMNVLGVGIGAAVAQQQQQQGGPNPAQLMFQGGLGIVSSIIGIGVAVLILVGGMKMMKLQSYGLAMTAAIVAVIPCISPCCLIGLPFGIWAIVALSDASVKAAFH